MKAFWYLNIEKKRVRGGNESALSVCSALCDDDAAEKR